MPEIPPVAVAPLPMGTTHLSADVLAIEHGKPVRVSTTVDFYSSQPWGSEYDRGLEEIETAMEDAMAVWEVHGSAAILKQAELWGGFRSALHAARYHQKQFLARHVIVQRSREFFRQQRGTAIRANFADAALIIEFEAYMLRLRASLDATAKLLAFMLGWKDAPTFGRFRNSIRDIREPGPHERALKFALDEHDEVLAKLKAIRDAVAHDGRSSNAHWDALRTEPIQDPMIEDVLATELVMEAWIGSRAALVSLASALNSRD